jgi:hypothetical protein
VVIVEMLRRRTRAGFSLPPGLPDARPYDMSGVNNVGSNLRFLAGSRIGLGLDHLLGALVRRDDHAHVTTVPDSVGAVGSFPGTLVPLGTRD